MQLQRKTLSNYLKYGPILSRLQILGFGRDWQDILYDAPAAFWLFDQDPDRVASELMTKTGQPWVAKRKGENRVTFETDGSRIDAFKPGRGNGCGKRYDTTCQVHGRSFARGIDLGVFLDEIETPIFGRAMVDGRLSGRIDLAFDVWIRPGWPDWIEPIDILRSLHAHGNPARALAGDWKTHFRKPGLTANIVGAERSETFYLGSRSVLMLRIYRKDLEFDGNTKSDLVERWRARGYDGSGVVARVEFEIKREYLRTHSVRGVQLSRFHFSDWPLMIEILANSLTEQIAHCPDYDPKCREAVDHSLLWLALRYHAKLSGASEPVSRYFPAPDIDRALADLERAIWRAQEVAGLGLAERTALAAADCAAEPVALRRELWQEQYLWTGYHERIENERRRKAEAAEHGGQFQIEFGTGVERSEGARTPGSAGSGGEKAG